MNQEKPKDIAASVRQKLLNRARQQKEDFQLILTRYALERFLFRLSKSKYKDNFVLKGAFMFLIWMAQPYRPTRDLDLLGLGEDSTKHLISVFKKICSIRQDDGLEFVMDSVSAEEIRDNQEYNGVRITFTAELKGARIPLQIDIGFGDIVTPKSRIETFPTILDMPSPKLQTYPKETVIAEKYEAMIRWGIANSRMKDFYDIWILQKEFNFEGAILSKAIRATFNRRNTVLPENTPLALSPDFYMDTSKQVLWAAFFNRTLLRPPVIDFKNIIKEIHAFLIPPTKALIQDKKFNLFWTSGGPWKKTKNQS